MHTERVHIRKELKAGAKKVLRRHYGLFVLLCMVTSLLGGEIALSGSVWKSVAAGRGTETNVTFSDAAVRFFVEFAMDVAEGNAKVRQKEIDETQERYVEESEKNRDAVLGRSRGVFALVANKLASGAYLMTLMMGIRSLVGTDSGAVVVLLIGAMILMLLAEVFVTGVFRTAVFRMFLEGRCYERVPMQRAWFLLRVKKWCHVGMVQFVTSIFSLLWGLTLVGGIVKRYSYYLVPCILAENPAIGALDAITLSRRLMNGHKWECFVLEMSFLGWDVLGVCTWGISDVLFNTPYKTAVLGEYYVSLRGQGQREQIENSRLLKDRFLFEKAEREILEEAYKDVEEGCGTGAQTPKLVGADKFFAEVLGLAVRHKKEFELLEEEQSRKLLMEDDKKALEGKIYPMRLHPIPEKKKRKWLASLNYLRYYSVWSVIMMFFALSFAGWLWEVSLHLLTDGEFVNRGVLHGPWLPIYGCGSVLILLLLHSFRKRPVAEFLLAMTLCGCVEYFTSLCLEIAHDGTRWWDYTGYFLNLHGRICAEGLLVFGVGGMAIVYVLAPFLDGLFRKIPLKLLVGAAVVLLGVFAADQIYSWNHPNTGDGITSHGAVRAGEEVASAW